MGSVSNRNRAFGLTLGTKNGLCAKLPMAASGAAAGPLAVWVLGEVVGGASAFDVPLLTFTSSDTLMVTVPPASTVEPTPMVYRVGAEARLMSVNFLRLFGTKSPDSNQHLL